MAKFIGQIENVSVAEEIESKAKSEYDAAMELDRAHNTVCALLTIGCVAILFALLSWLQSVEIIPPGKSVVVPMGFLILLMAAINLARVWEITQPLECYYPLAYRIWRDTKYGKILSMDYNMMQDELTVDFSVDGEANRNRYYVCTKKGRTDVDEVTVDLAQGIVLVPYELWKKSQY